MEKVIENYKNSNAYSPWAFIPGKRRSRQGSELQPEAYDFNNTNAVILDNLGCTRLLRENTRKPGKYMSNS